MPGLRLIIFFSVACLPFQHARADAHKALRDFGHRMVGGTWHHVEPDNRPDEHSYRWQLGDKFIVRVAVGEKHLAVLGVDPLSKTTKWWTFHQDGTVDIITWEEQETGDGTYSVVIPDGKFPGTYRIEHKPDDRLEITPVNVPSDSPIQVKQVWQRRPLEGSFPNVSSDPPTNIPASLGVLKHVTGPKWIEGQFPDGQRMVGGLFGQWILDGKFFLYSAASSTEDQSAWSYLFVAGIDPDTGKATGWEFDSDGHVGKFIMSDDGYSLAGKSVQADGTIFEYSGKHELIGDVLKYTALGKTEADPSMPYHWNTRAVK